jgi:hypothetical protein
MLYIHTFNNVKCKLYLVTADLLQLTDSGKRQTRPLLRENASHQQACNSDNNKDLVLSPRWVLYS